MFQFQITSAIIILVLGRVAFTYPLSITRNFQSHTKLLAGGFGKSPSVKKDKNSKVPKATEPVKEEIIRYVTKKGDGSCVAENHCESFNIVYPKIRAVHSDPPIFEIDDFFSKELCESYIGRSTEGTEILCQPLAGSATTKRTSQTKYLKYENAQEMIDAAETLTGILSNRYEEPQVVHYLPGQQFTWHYDAIQPHLQDSSGNRIATLIVYLNDCKIGGETSFRDLELKVTPVRGKALIFFPSFKDGIIDDRTLHCGSIAMDEKWIAQIWIRHGVYEPAMRDELRRLQLRLHRDSIDQGNETEVEG